MAPQPPSQLAFNSADQPHRVDTAALLLVGVLLGAFLGGMVALQLPSEYGDVARRTRGQLASWATTRLKAIGLTRYQEEVRSSKSSSMPSERS